MTCPRSRVETGLDLLFFLILILCLNHKLSFVIIQGISAAAAAQLVCVVSYVKQISLL